VAPALLPVWVLRSTDGRNFPLATYETAQARVPVPPKPFIEWDEDSDEGVQTTSAELEKSLKRLAQKGVVKLFNAIRAAQATEEEVKDGEGSKHKLIRTTAPSTVLPGDGIDKSRANVLGTKGKEQALANLSRASFLEILKSGNKFKAGSSTASQV